ncbi:MAG: hypothetical protein HY042_07525, partial [Spirochaetia bacterium]|nr:hypothetical protein [Spirochaetia bacterium]
MELLHALGSKIFLNFYSFGASLETVFTLFVALFLLTLKGKSKSTVHMGLAFLMLTPFNAAYILAAGYYDPFAAYHRWLTVFFVTPAMIHFAQWIFRFPSNTHPRVARTFMIVQWIISVALWIWFVFKTYTADKTFLFDGHQWDFDADDTSRIIAFEIMGFLLIMVVVGIWKTVITKTRERWAPLQITIVFVISVLLPVVTNVLSRGGLMDRGTHQTAKSLALVVGYFLIVLTYVNNTQDRTSFMAKIIGITLVTFLVTMQGLSFYTVRDREKTYDVLRVENVERAVEGGQRNEQVEYVVRVAMNGEKDPAKQVQFLYQKSATGIPFRDLEEEFFNTAVLERIQGLAPAGYA